jgi:hypothetical protein
MTKTVGVIESWDRRSCIINSTSKSGFKVTFEKNSYPGGKLSELNMNGFRFDKGPSFTMPSNR